jgi:hypothetical protein
VIEAMAYGGSPTRTEMTSHAKTQTGRGLSTREGVATRAFIDVKADHMSAQMSFAGYNDW